MRLFTTRDDVCKFFLMNSLTSVANKAARTSWRVIMWPLKGNSFASPIIKNKLKIHVVVPCPSDSKTFWSTSMELLYFPARIKSLSTCANFWLFQNFILVWQFWQKEIFPVSSFGATKDHKCCLASPCVRLQVVWMVKASKCKSKDTPRLYYYFSMLSDTIFFHTLRGGHSWLLGHLRRFCGDIDCLLFSEQYILFKEIGKLFCRSYEDKTTSTRKLCVKNSAT